MAIIYVADDEKNIRELLGSFLTEAGFEVSLFETGDQLFLAFLDQPADLVVLDVMMPGSSGFDIAKRLRQISQVPLIFLTARDSDRDVLEGFGTGADDYLTKPFSPLQLTLRIEAMIKRLTSQSQADHQLAYGGLVLSDKSRQVTDRGQQLKLTNTEFDLLRVLMTEPEVAISRDRLLEEVWGYDSLVETRVTDDTIKRLRKKLRDQTSQVAIETVWGYGFKLVTRHG